MNGKARFIAVTSGCGGVGTSSLAVALGRVLSRLNEKRVLYITFDFLASKCDIPGGATRRDFLEYYQNLIFAEGPGTIDISEDIVCDSYGLNYLKCDAGINPLHLGIDNIPAFLINLNIEYDAVILDVPCNNMTGITIFPLCEDIVMNYGIARRHQKKYCDDFMDLLDLICRDSKLHSFESATDLDSFTNGDVDIHGEFGAGVRRLAAELGF